MPSQKGSWCALSKEGFLLSDGLKSDQSHKRLIIFLIVTCHQHVNREEQRRYGNRIFLVDEISP